MIIFRFACFVVLWIFIFVNFNDFCSNTMIYLFLKNEINHSFVVSCKIFIAFDCHFIIIFDVKSFFRCLVLNRLWFTLISFITRKKAIFEIKTWIRMSRYLIFFFIVTTYHQISSIHVILELCIYFDFMIFVLSFSCFLILISWFWIELILTFFERVSSKHQCWNLLWCRHQLMLVYLEILSIYDWLFVIKVCDNWHINYESLFLVFWLWFFDFELNRYWRFSSESHRNIDVEIFFDVIINWCVFI